ncbi:anaphase-promoting complex subunit 2 isoform X1 [Glycine max]|uniref:anaphase-promoting complex subunit 2 isoform X1 n=2 Tax=Glycine max TaxID=3847 RepID=UPI001B354C44|nr:anaphase-promoting complex subunit 2 isoform X1 [Glycine max]XP_040862813.1 anaphase-promoting complex subunit 2 isoform X1 [Glycine max]
MEEPNPCFFNPAILDSLTDDSVHEILDSYNDFCNATQSLLAGNGDLSVASDFVSHVHTLCKHRLRSLVQDHFFRLLEETFERNGASRFWRHFDPYFHVAGLNKNDDLDIDEDEIQSVLYNALEEITLEKQYQEKCLLMLVHALQSYKDQVSEDKHGFEGDRNYLTSKYQWIVSSVLMASLSRHFPVILHWYFKRKLEEVSAIMDGEFCDDASQNKDGMNLDEKGKICNKVGEMDVDECYSDHRFSENSRLVKNIGKVVLDLRNLGFTSMAEDAYASAIFLLLKAKVHDVAGDDFRSSVLQSIKSWIQAVPLQFLHALLVYLGDVVSYESTSSGLKSPLAPQPSSCCPGIDTPSEGLVRWKLRLEYFAYETLQDLRIAKLFEIIVDYPESSPAIEDLKLCLEYTGQHSKLVESFISALRYRLLTAGASTNDILHQYVSTIKALRTIDPAGVFLEAVGEPIRDYLRGRRDTIKCIVTMMTDGTGAHSSSSGNPGDSLLEELNRDEEIQENAGVDDFNTDDRQAWINAMRWQPDPVEADPLKGSRNQRKVDILGMIVSIIGSKDQLVHEYRTMLAEKLLNKSDYDIDSEIRTLELLKIHFGESSLQKCEIMLNDLIGSKRTNSNIKATINQPSQTSVEVGDNAISMDAISATIISSNFWPPIQDEPLNLPEPVDQLLSDYAKRFNEIKTPRKLQWKKSLGTIKLELQFQDREIQFTVAPVHASIIMKFQDQPKYPQQSMHTFSLFFDCIIILYYISSFSWTSKNLAAAIGIPADVLNRRINFWISKGIIAESQGADSSDHVYTIVENMAETSKNGASTGCAQELLGGEEEEERSVASVENQLRKEMTVYEKFILGMLTNFGSMALDRIHNTLKMFCIADPPYDKSLQQLQSFLSGLVSEEKLELRDGMYFLKK